MIVNSTTKWQCSVVGPTAVAIVVQCKIVPKSIAQLYHCTGPLPFSKRYRQYFSKILPVPKCIFSLFCWPVPVFSNQQPVFLFWISNLLTAVDK